MAAPTGTAQTAGSIHGFFVLLSWIAVLIGAAITGTGVWFLGFHLDLGWNGWYAAGGWAFAWTVLTSFVWAFTILGALIAEYIEVRTLDQQERLLL